MKRAPKPKTASGKVARKPAPKKKAAAPVRAATQAAPAKASKAAVKKTRASPKASPDKAQGGRSPSERAEIAKRLARAVPDAVCELRFSAPWELLIATILAAQSTDKMVNAVMPGLLARYPSPRALAAAAQEDVEEVVKRTGFYRNKAKAIRGAAQHLLDHHDGEVPRTIEALVAVPGVARKTANVVLGTAYRIAAGFVVDTHVTRVSQRLGLTRETDPVRIEQDLCGGFPRESWVDLGHRFVLHGRYTCLAKRPECAQCTLNELCPSRLTVSEGSWDTRADAEAGKVAASIVDHASIPAIH
ncbi:MAG: endonuclease III [Polyangiales bacterium]